MEEVSTDHEPLIRVMALHAIAYCERLFYLEEVEEIHVADSSVYAGRTLHEELKQDEEETGEWTSMELSSESLGLTGKVDCLRRRDGHLIPYEHKRGRAAKSGKTTYAWPADVMQVSAYGMLLEEETGETIPEGRVRYHASNLTIRVPLDDSARQAIRNAVSRARELRTSITRPPVTPNDRLCIHCSLAPVCLPEEERLASDAGWEPVRLFPADRELKTVHVVQHGARISRSGNTLKIESTEADDVQLPIHEVDAIVLHGYPQITTQALHFCIANSIAIHWISTGGRYVAGLGTGADRVQRCLRQYHALTDAGTCLSIARKLVMAKVENCLRYILRASREGQRSISAVTESIETLRNCLKQSAHVDDLDSLRGFEGVAGRAYFSALATLISENVPQTMKFEGRNRRPPKDRFNALLGFGYALVHQAVLQSIRVVGLEPSIGFFHTPRSAAHPLALDIMELFRLPLWDIVLIGSINRLQWDPEADFAETKGGIWLSDIGRRKAIQLFERRIAETWKHPVINYSLSYSRLIELEVRLLEKEWAGQPGLFAKMRLR